MLQKPRYSDGDLTLIYFGGEECSSGFQRMSVINFECNQTAGECAWRQWRLCVGGLGSWKQRAGGVVRPSPADGAPQGPLCGSGQEEGPPPPPPTQPMVDTHILFSFSVCSGSGPGTRLAGKAFLSRVQLSLGCGRSLRPGLLTTF